MGAEQLLREYGVDMVTEGHKHATAGWVSVHCPFCNGGKDYHMGINEELNACNCWRCGRHDVAETISLVIKLPQNQVWALLKKHRTGKVRMPAPEAKVSIRPFKYPAPLSTLNSVGKAYLRSRNFDPSYIAEEWGVMQTGPIAKLDNLAYPNRLIIPIEWNGGVVSFQSRDITGQSDKKYLVCPQDREIVNHKNILYGKQEEWNDLSGLIVVEGVMDVWRFGGYAAATFGTSYTIPQVIQLSKCNDRFIIIFDNEPEAQAKARELAVRLKGLGKEVLVRTVPDDPANLSQKEANKLIGELL